MLITFEGIDGSGKSTQIERLDNYLQEQGFKTATFREPGGTEVSEEIRRLLLDSSHELNSITELFLFSAARSQLITDKVVPLLDEGYIVILDRFYDSTTAYQGYGRGDVSVKNIEQINRLASHQISPDITFYLKISVQEGRSRVNRQAPDRMEQSDDDFYRRVIRGFNKLADRHDRFITVDSSEAEETVASKIVKHVNRKLQK